MFNTQQKLLPLSCAYRDAIFSPAVDMLWQFLPKRQKPLHIPEMLLQGNQISSMLHWSPLNQQYSFKRDRNSITQGET